MKIGKQTKELIAQAEADIKGRMKKELEVWRIRLAEPCTSAWLGV